MGYNIALNGMRKGCVVVEIKKWKAKKGVGRRKGMSN
jgi:hypothetical protein